jgi:hypothetical protein
MNGDQFGDIYTPELDRVMQGDVLGVPPKGAVGGEWDTLRSYPARTLRSLHGAGYLSKGGLAPDVAATHRIGPGTGKDDTDSAVDWYVKHATGALQERRQESRRNRDQRRATRAGYKTPFQQRSFAAVEAGHDTYREMRKARGWSG